MSSIDFQWLQARQLEVEPIFRRLEQNALHIQKRVMDAFAEERVSTSDLLGSNGYGIDDAGREKLERIFARVFAAEAALVRPQFVSGTHALSTSLFALCRPGDHVLFATGQPYDTLQAVVGLRESPGSLREWGIESSVVELDGTGMPQTEQIIQALRPNTRLVMFQKSRGYSSRPALSLDKLAGVFSLVKTLRPDVWLGVDNCYGEFVEVEEVTAVGADFAAGSLIKNPGGGLVSSGGYIVGKKSIVDAAAVSLYAPGIGAELGATEGYLRSMYQGLFLAPHIVCQALKISVLASHALHELGYRVSPLAHETRADIVLEIEFHSRQEVAAFATAIQSSAPVDSFAVPEFGDMAGYDTPVLMAAGTFIQGSSIELSADAPLRPPYRAYLQGGLTYEQGFWAVLRLTQVLAHLRHSQI